jgi:AcrR family transcriptional regulator
MGLSSLFQTFAHLFNHPLENGYSATAISEVARKAGVSLETIYAVFGTKRELLSQLIEFAMAGDEEQAEG